MMPDISIRAPDMLYPVILPVSPEDRRLAGADRVRSLSRIARRALAVCAEKSGLKIGEFIKNADGVPMPDNGVYWSVTHKPEYVAGILGLSPVGIDLEKIRPIHQGLFHRVADDEQWALDDSEPLIRFFRFWTAKEAVLKACGIGLRSCQMPDRKGGRTGPAFRALSGKIVECFPDFF
jgi:4'-phosphopantetheinyl transferase